MSLAGFKKQLNKANQYVSEKIGGAKGSEMDDDFVEMERKIDVMGNLVNELMARTHEHLQPNPASRAKLSAVKSISKFRGQANVLLYPQPEGQLGECMAKYGMELGDESLFGGALAEAGEAYKQLADVKYGLEDSVKQNFIEPLHHIQTKDLKEVNHHRKKLSGRRLDYDCKRRKHVKAGSSSSSSGVTEEDVYSAESKLQESKQLAETAMHNLLENDVEQISALASFIESEVTFHRQAQEVLQGLHETLQVRIEEAANRPRREHVPRRVTSFSTFDKTPSPSGFGNHEKSAQPPHGNNLDVADHSGYSLSPAQPPSYGQTMGSRGSTASMGDVYDPKSGTKNPFKSSASSSSLPVSSIPSSPPPDYTADINDYAAIGDPFGPFTTSSFAALSTGAAQPTQQTTIIKPPRNNTAAKADATGNGTAVNSGNSDPFGGIDPFATYDNNQGNTTSSSFANPPSQQPQDDFPEYAAVDWTKKRASQSNGRSPCAEALYDFEPENEGELGFKEGDVIQLTQRIDENWFEGTVHGISGFFPVNYVKVLVDIQ